MRLLLILIFISLSIAAFSQTDVFEKGETAFEGNDIVSYYSGKALAGKASFSVKHNGVIYWFANSQNQKLFQTDPEKYLPAYGGHCAIALTHGNLIRPDFNHFKIQDNELLFFEIRAFFNGKTAWDKDPKLNKIIADKKYNELVKAN